MQRGERGARQATGDGLAERDHRPHRPARGAEAGQPLGHLVGVAARFVEVAAGGGAVRAGGRAAQMALEEREAGLFDRLRLAQLLGDQVRG